MARARAILPHKQVLVVIASIIFLGSSRVAPAQELTRFDLFGGYSYQRLDATAIGYADNANQNGWFAGATGNLNGSFGLTAQISGHYGSHLDAYAFLAGPQVSWRKPKYRVFGYALFGKADDHLNLPEVTRTEFTSVSFAASGGGGFDWNITRRFTFRVVQADYLHTHTFGNTENNIRVSTGLVMHFVGIGKHHKP